MTVDISNSELARRMDEFIRDVREDMAELNRRAEVAASQNLSREVYEAKHANLVLRVERLEAEQRRMADEIRSKELSLQAEQKKKEETQQAEQRANRRLLISAVVMPTVLTVITLIMNFQGPV